MEGARTLAAAEFSPCETYRYVLRRRVDWFSESIVSFVMLNPSTADEIVDDPTIRRCQDFARRWGHGWLYVVNLSPVRSASPDVMKRALPEPTWAQESNIEAIGKAALESDQVVAAWGATPASHTVLDRRVGLVVDTIRKARPRPIECLGRTKDGSPLHPLYVAAATTLEMYL